MDFYGILFDIKNGSKMPYSKNYFDTLFAQKLEELGVKTITGVLPLTFTIHTAGAADTWTIYGNDDNGTENEFNANIVQGYYNTTNGKPMYSSRYVRSDKQVISSGETYTFSFNCSKVAPAGSGKDVWVSFWAADNHYIGYRQETQYIDHTTFTTPENAGYVALFVGAGANGEMTPTDISDVMLVKGSIAPDHYIPYQKGVGERTENLFDKTTVTQYRMINSSTGEVVSSFSSRCVTDWIDIEQSDTISISYISVQSGAFYDSNKQYISGINSYGANKSVPAGAQYVRLTVLLEALDYFMLVKGSTAPETYIPFGYEIPITVSQDGQTDKNYDIFIGDSPLTEGETVSKQSTGIDLELFEGENTVSTTLYNKPTMTITYK